MNIALFGGRFDPPHLGHYWVVQQILEFGPEIDRVVIVPAAKHQWKPIDASNEDRLAMLDQFKDHQTEINSMELKRGGISYTIDTLRDYKQLTNANLFWVVGSDILRELYKWEKADELTRLATFLVFPRDPYMMPEKLPGGFVSLKEKNLITSNISSTILRERRKKNMSLKGYVLPQTFEYIEEKGLYL